MDLNFEQSNLIYKTIKNYILNNNSPLSYYCLYSYINNKTLLNFIDSKYRENIYKKNFLIKNILYRLQFEFYRDFGFALIFEADLIYFEKIPNYPSYFSILKGKFIPLEKTELIKKNLNNTKLPKENSLRDFYFCMDNFFKDEESIEKAMEAGLAFISEPTLFEEALKTFNLTQASLNIKSLNEAYRRLVKKYHPDLQKDIDIEKEKELLKINDFYNMLKNLLRF